MRNENNSDFLPDNVIKFKSDTKEPSYEAQIREYEEFTKELEKNKRIAVLKRLMIFLGLFTIVAVGIFLFLLYNKHRIYRDAGVRYSRLSSEVLSGYAALGGSLIRYGKDGALLIDDSGKELWNESYNMKQPIIDISGSYAAIADLYGNSLCLFDKSGKLCELSSAATIAAVRTSANGIIMLVSEDDSMTYITYYYKDGRLLAEGQYPLSKSRFPVAYDISRNGIGAAVGVMGYDGIQLHSQIAFVGFDRVASVTKQNNLISSVDIEDRLILDMDFSSSDRLLALTDRGIHIFSPLEENADSRYIEFKGVPESVIYNDRYIVYTLDEANGSTAYAYDYSGNMVSTVTLLNDYDKILLNNDFLVTAANDRLSAYRLGDGRKKLELTVSGDIRDVIAMGDRLRYLVVYDRKLELIELS